MAELAGRRGEPGEAAHWRARGEGLRAAVEARFWVEELGYYALALDGDGRPCRVRGSNAGHLLFAGLPTRERAGRVAAQLLAPPFNSGWGIRTLAAGERRFNPMSYHNGSVWPHDTALCAAGLSRYGEREGGVRLVGGLFRAPGGVGMRPARPLCGLRPGARAAASAPPRPSPPP